MGKSENFTAETADPAEETLWTAHPSVWRYGQRWAMAILLAPFGIGLVYGAWLYGSARCTQYQLTTERLIWTRGIFTRRQDQVELYRVRDVSLVQPFYLRVLGLGNILVMSSDISTPNDHLLAVKQPQDVLDLVRAAVEAVRDRRGIRAVDFETR